MKTHKAIVFFISSLLIIAALFIGYFLGIESTLSGTERVKCLTEEDFKKSSDSQKQEK